jgi:glycosyltransferase involved in cell wall biosynthesis
MSAEVRISCIMPTRNRAEFAARAVQYFLTQSYKDSELIVIDDGTEPLKVPPSDSRIKYIRLQKRITLGGKLNLGISVSRGAVLQRMDDDDYYHAEFIRTALSHLICRGVERSIVAWGHFLIYLAGEDCARSCNLGWAAGPTLCFSRKVWERGHFPDVASGEDSGFIKDHTEELVTVCAPELFMLVRHGRNTWITMRDSSTVDRFLASLPRYPKKLENVIGPENFDFYRKLPALSAR